jgi:hypothetical protein
MISPASFAAPGLLKLLDSAPQESSVWSYAAWCVTQADSQSELTRICGCLDINPSDFAQWTAEKDGSEADRISTDTVESYLPLAFSEGASTSHLLRTVLFGEGPFHGMRSLAADTWGISQHDFRAAQSAAQMVTDAAVSSAAEILSAEHPESGAELNPALLAMLHGPLPSHPEPIGLVMPSSQGLAMVLRRADGIRDRHDQQTISSACLLRALLPWWSTPPIRKLLHGLGVGTDISTAYWLNEHEEHGAGQIRLDAHPKEFLLSEAAMKVMLIASDLRDGDQTATTADHVLLGMLAVESSALARRATSAVGEHVNLPLMYIQADARVAVSAGVAHKATHFSRASAGLVKAIDDMPPRRRSQIGRAIHPWDSPVVVRLGGHRRAAEAVRRWEQLSQPPTGMIDSAAPAGTSPRFLRTGHLQSLRDAVSNLAPAEFSDHLLAAEISRGDRTELNQRDLIQLGSRDGSGPVARLSSARSSSSPDLSALFRDKLIMLSTQDWCALDIDTARFLGVSATGIAMRAADEGNWPLAAAASILDSRAAARSFRARHGLPSGIPGSGLSLAAADMAEATGTLVILALDGVNACAVRVGAAPFGIKTPFSRQSALDWWKRYRLCCLRREPTDALYTELAAKTGLDQVLTPTPASPLRVCAAGAFRGLPIGQAAATCLPGREVPVVTHLGGGPFVDRFSLALAPTGRLAGRAAVVSPPWVNGTAQLPFAEAEADAVARIHDAKIKFGSTASERAKILRVMELDNDAHRPLMWHFAAHGTVMPTAGGQLTAGVLVVDHELLSSLDIGQYVRGGVLICSACDIAAFASHEDEGSWPLAALAGGAAHVVAAPRPVSDPITMIMMIHMHERWVQDQSPIHEALHAAQRWTDEAAETEVKGNLWLHGIPAQLVNSATSALRQMRQTQTRGDHWAFSVSTL